MEAHPVPQNVTAFEFHLVGNMTMRQFGYLAAGMGLAYIVFMLFGTSLPILAYPIIILSASLGAAYAFLPIMDRPLDHWTMAFIKAITNPTIRRYESKRLGIQDPKFKNRLNIYLQQLQQDEASKPKKPSALSIRSIALGPQPTPEIKPIPKPSQETPNEEKKDESPPEPPKLETAPTPPPPPQEQTSVHTESEKVNDAVSDFLQDLSSLAKQQPQAPEHQPLPSPPPPPQPTATPPESIPIPAALSPSPPTPPPSPVSQPLPQSVESASLDRLSNNPLPSTEELLTPPVPLGSPEPEELPSKEELDKTVHLAKEAQVVQNQIIAAEKQIDAIKTGAASAGVDPQKYTQEFQAVLSTLQKLNQKAREISHDLAVLSNVQNNQTLVNEPATKPNIIPTLTLTSIPNILNGIVTDAQGNYIEGSIIVAHDKQGLPVRALKTNKLGQYIAATPLSDGTYTISVEKEDLSFDVIQVELTGKVLNPIVISAKKGI